MLMSHMAASSKTAIATSRSISSGAGHWKCLTGRATGDGEDRVMIDIRDGERGDLLSTDDASGW